MPSTFSPTVTRSIARWPARAEHRALVVLHYYLGMPLPEAASSLGLTLGTAKSRLHRAMGTLRRTFVGDADPATPVPGGQP